MGKTYKMNAITGELDLVENLEEINAALEKGILKSVDVSGENMIFTFNTPDLAPVTVPLAHFATNLQGHAYIGLATPSTTPVNLKGNEKVFYIASEEGIYSNFGVGNISELSIIKSDNGSWKVEELGVLYSIKASNLFDIENSFVSKAGAIKTEQSSYKRTDYLPIESLHRVKGWDGGTSYDMKAITFFDASKTFIGYYDRQSTSGLFDVKLSDIEIPENAGYAIVSQLNSYPTTYWLGPVKPEILPAMVDTIPKLGNTYLAIEAGVYPNFGNIKVDNVSLLSDKNGTWMVYDTALEPFVIKANDFSYAKGYYSASGEITAYNSAMVSEPIPIQQLYRIKGLDRGADHRALTFFDDSYNYVSQYDFGANSIEYDILISEIVIPNNAKYVSIVQYESVPTTYWLRNKKSASLSDVFVDKYTYTKKAKQTRMAVWLNDFETKSNKIKIKADWDTSLGYDLSYILVYKASRLHKDLARLGTLYKGEWLDLELDSEYPVLYLYNSSITDGYIEPYNVQVTIQSSSGTSIEERLERAETEIEDIKSTNPMSWYGKNVVVFGDSITEFKDINGKTYCDHIAELTFANVINVGVGGTQFRQRTQPVSSPASSNEAYAALDIINMVKASCDSDFEKQVNAATYLKDNASDNNIAIVERLQAIDWLDVHAVIIMAGTNDWNNASTKWGDPTSSDVNYTFGAINEIVRLLLTTYPHVKLYWFTPTVRWLTDDEGNRTADTWSDNFMRNNKNLREFSAMVFEAVSLHHIPICDMYNTLGWNMYNFDQFFSSTDGTHPTKGKGMEEIAKKIVSFINANKTF